MFLIALVVWAMHETLRMGTVEQMGIKVKGAVPAGHFSGLHGEPGILHRRAGFFAPAVWVLDANGFLTG